MASSPLKTRRRVATKARANAAAAVDGDSDFEDDLAGGIPELKFATSSEMFDTKFKVPDTLDKALQRLDTNFRLYNGNYLVFIMLCFLVLGWRRGSWCALPLVMAHSVLKTRSLASRVTDTINSFFG
eukprot:m.42995 g.42995  ORF g.42995 m.42995 type:complete len:127 (+) comp6348_c0_seq1:294-674(+)